MLAGGASEPIESTYTTYPVVLVLFGSQYMQAQESPSPDEAAVTRSLWTQPSLRVG
jgi:hypothetical protein